MRLDNIFPSPVLAEKPNPETGQMEILGYNVNAQTVKNSTTTMSFNFYISAKELKNYEMSYEKAAEAALADLLELDIVKVDAFEAEKLKRNTESLANEINTVSTTTTAMITELAIALSNVERV